jgi:hypothetical protein
MVLGPFANNQLNIDYYSDFLDIAREKVPLLSDEKVVGI